MLDSNLSIGDVKVVLGKVERFQSNLVTARATISIVEDWSTFADMCPLFLELGALDTVNLQLTAFCGQKVFI